MTPGLLEGYYTPKASIFPRFCITVQAGLWNKNYLPPPPNWGYGLWNISQYAYRPRYYSVVVNFC